jgi:hypothetical protein
METLSNLLTAVKANSSHREPFKIAHVGIQGVKRSIIPNEVKIMARFDLDESSYTELSIQALKLGFTTDELLRQLVWTAITL